MNTHNEQSASTAAPILPIPPGTFVQVRDGAPEPPARFKRKHADWERGNFDGVVTRHNAPGDYTPIATYDVQSGDLFHPALKVIRSCVNPVRVTVVPGAPRYTLSTDRFSPVVTGIEKADDAKAA